MKTVTIIQARTSSTRLPNKVMLDVYGTPLLERVIDQSLRIRNSDALWVATSTHGDDDLIEWLCERKGVPCYRGSLEDVRSRFYEIGKKEEADFVVRVTADNPLTEPEYADELIECLENNPGSFYARMEKSSILDGSGCEVFTFSILEKAVKEFTGQKDREHVNWSILQLPGILEPVPGNKELVARKPFFLGVDTFEDYKKMNILFRTYSGNSDAHNVLKQIIKRINNNEEVI